MSKILIVEDDENLGNSLTKYFKDEGLEVTWKKSIADAKEIIANDSFDLLVLDWMLPDGQGIDLLRDIRSSGGNLPIIMLTAKAELIDKVLGLETGANDYLTKPFEPRELIARVRVQLRSNPVDSKMQKPQINNQEIIVASGLEINLSFREIHFEGKLLDLTKMEYELLVLLAENPGRAFSRESILNKVWGLENYPTTRTVDTHVLQLRQKTCDSLIETIRGVGYRLKK